MNKKSVREITVEMTDEEFERCQIQIQINTLKAMALAIKETPDIPPLVIIQETDRELSVLLAHSQNPVPVDSH